MAGQPGGAVSTEATMKSILLVEDEPLIALGEVQTLEREGYQVKVVSTGEEAVGTILKAPSAFDLVLMDVFLGKGIDGIQAAQEILEHKDIPIVFLSARGDKDVVERTERITSYGFVAKISGPMVLIASIRMAFRLHEAHCALAGSEEKYSKAFHVSPDSININSLSDGKYLAVNGGFTKITGYSPEDVLDKSSIDPSLNIWVNPDDRIRLIELLKRDGEVTNFEAEFRMKSGEIRYGLMSASILDINGEQCILSFTRDISDRRAAREALAASNAALTAFINASPLAIVDVDFQQVVRRWNPAAEKLFGWTAEEVIGIENPIVPPHKCTEVTEWIERLEAGQKIYDVETERQRKDGSLVNVTISTANIPSLPGHAPSRIVIITDNTERKRSAEALQKLVKQEGVLRRELQHRVKNNLNILSSLLALETPRIADPAAQQVLVNAQNRLSIIARMYNHMNRSGEAGVLDLRTYIEDLAIPLVKNFSSNASIVLLNQAADDIALETRQVVPLGLILNELITNSLKYAYRAGTSGEIRIAAQRSSGYITVRVEDDGAGFKDGIYPQQTETLGLLLVRSLVDQIDGTVTFQSPPGVKVIITFPMTVVPIPLSHSGKGRAAG
jgi:PAS domain S-box-containing protein